MSLYPGASVRLIDTDFLSGKPIAVYNRVNLHVQAGEGSLFGFFNASGRASSHFWVSYGGTVEQYVDTYLRAEADLDGNDATISIETEGGTGSTADTEPWTEAQVEAIIALVAWITAEHGIPRVWVETAYAGQASSRGVGVHRHGINGNFPALPDIRAGRKQRGNDSQMLYSSSGGKLCPGGGKVQQVPYILSRINGGAVQPPTPLPPTEFPDSGGLVIDGQWGPATTRELQQHLGTPVDGVISHQWRSDANECLYAAEFDTTADGSTAIRAMQSIMGIEQDGLCGPDTIRALQARFGTPVDGVISCGYSLMVAEMQRRLVAGDAA